MEVKKKSMSLKDLAEYYEKNDMTFLVAGKKYTMKTKYIYEGTNPHLIFYEETHVKRFSTTKIFADGTYKTRPRRLNGVAQIYCASSKKYNQVR